MSLPRQIIENKTKQNKTKEGNTWENTCDT